MFVIEIRLLSKQNIEFLRAYEKMIPLRYVEPILDDEGNFEEIVFEYDNLMDKNGAISYIAYIAVKEALSKYYKPDKSRTENENEMIWKILTDEILESEYYLNITMIMIYYALRKTNEINLRKFVIFSLKGLKEDLTDDIKKIIDEIDSVGMKSPLLNNAFQDVSNENIVVVLEALKFHLSKSNKNLVPSPTIDIYREDNIFTVLTEDKVEVSYEYIEKETFLQIEYGDQVKDLDAPILEKNVIMDIVLVIFSIVLLDTKTIVIHGDMDSKFEDILMEELEYYNVEDKYPIEVKRCGGCDRCS